MFGSAHDGDHDYVVNLRRPFLRAVRFDNLHYITQCIFPPTRSEYSNFIGHCCCCFSGTPGTGSGCGVYVSARLAPETQTGNRSAANWIESSVYFNTESDCSTSITVLRLWYA